MTYIIFSAFIGLTALVVAVVPVAVILRREKQGGPGLAGPSVAADSRDDWPVTA